MASAPTESTEAGLEAVLNRRSPAKFTPEQPPKDVIEKLIAAAARAPNHFLNEPWRFFVVAGDERARLGDALAASLKARLPNPEAPQAQTQLQRERQKPFRSPVLIVAAAVRTENARSVRRSGKGLLRFAAGRPDCGLSLRRVSGWLERAIAAHGPRG